MFCHSSALIDPSFSLPQKISEQHENLLEKIKIGTLVNKPDLSDSEIEEFRSIISTHDPDSIEFALFEKTPLLHSIAGKGMGIKLVKVMAKMGADFNKKATLFENTPLLSAISNGCFSMALEIIHHSPKETDFNIQGCENTALHLAIGKGYKDKTSDGKNLDSTSLDLAKALVEKTDLNIRSIDGYTALHIACIRRDPEMITLLLANNADRKAFNDHGETPKDMIEKNYEQACQFLQTQAKAYLLDKAEFENSKEQSLTALEQINFG